MSSINMYDVLSDDMSLDEFRALDTSTSTFYFHSTPVYFDPEKVKTFHRSTTCIACGLEAKTVRIEKNSNSSHPIYGNYHLNLYGYRKNKKVMITVDHDILKRDGGANCSSNYNTMCEQCNRRRGDRFKTCAEFLESNRNFSYDEFERQKQLEKQARKKMCVSHVKEFYLNMNVKLMDTPEAQKKRKDREQKKLLKGTP